MGLVPSSPAYSTEGHLGHQWTLQKVTPPWRTWPGVCFPAVATPSPGLRVEPLSRALLDGGHAEPPQVCREQLRGLPEESQPPGLESRGPSTCLGLARLPGSAELCSRRRAS